MTPRQSGTRLTRPLVLHVIDSLDISGGAERQLVANLKAFDHTKLSHEVALVKSTPTTREDEISGLGDIHVLFLNGEKISRLRVVRRLRKLIRDRRPALMHASLPDAGLATRLAGRLEGIAVLESLVNISHEEIRTVDNPNVTKFKLRLHTLLDRATMRSVAGFHAVSHAVAESWTRVVGLDPNRIRVIPRGVDLGNLGLSVDQRAANRESVREEFGLPRDSMIVLSVGRVEPQKGHRYLVEATEHVLASHPNVRVLIVGRHALAATDVSNRIEKLDLSDVVQLVGPRHDVPRLLSAADVFAFPSLFEGNGGNAMIEAMAAGLAIVTTGAAPMTDLVPDDRFGRLVPRRDSEALADAISSLLADSGLRRELGSRAAARARGFAAPDEIASRYESWYSELLGIA